MRIQEISDLTRLNIINTDDGNKKTGVFFVFFLKKKKKFTGLTIRIVKECSYWIDASGIEHVIHCLVLN